MPFQSKMFLFYIEVEGKKSPEKILVEEIKICVLCDIDIALPHEITVALWAETCLGKPKHTTNKKIS